ncbi:histidine phosphatase family protein [Roseibium sp. RKSG952]|uniref:histidine phosphatase family protein n=1 Tax=Roseibium sp. RKSG952 TaxID=2529384 RepID=UPI0012BD1AC7|nr:histidine phosphatase family protein [Roseibium sp. RKSG952]MTI00229.1 histidine phosphatase family protein [Roseibium sp. RKSG952]
MLKTGKILALLIVLAASIGSAAMSAAQASERAWQALADGGIVLFRHALAPGTGDPRNFRLGDCSTQRNLNGQGRAEAQAIGKEFRQRGIRAGEVLTSQWCRCVETAELAFPGRVREAPVFNSFYANRTRGPRQTRQALEILSAWQGPGALVVVTHQVNITALTGIIPRSGEGIVVQVTGNDLAVVGRIPVPRAY